MTLTQPIIAVDSEPTQVDFSPQIDNSSSLLLQGSSWIIESDSEQTIYDPIVESPNFSDCSSPTVLGSLFNTF